MAGKISVRWGEICRGQYELPCLLRPPDEASAVAGEEAACHSACIRETTWPLQSHQQRALAVAKTLLHGK